MKSINKVFLVGRLGAAPELRTTKTGKTYARLSVATHRNWKTEEGKYENRTDWHRITVWGTQAERCADRLGKGSPIFVEGHITRFQIPGEAESPRYQTSISADQVSFLSMPLQRSEPLEGFEEERSAVS